MAKIKYNTRKKISWEDVQDLVRNVKAYYDSYTIGDKAPLMLLTAIFLIYREHMDKQADKNINLNMEANRPEILRSEVIKKYIDKEPDRELFKKYRIDKGWINKKLKEFISKKDKKTGRILNPKGLVLVTASRKGEAEKANYFVVMEKPALKPLLPVKDQQPLALLTPIQVFKRNFEKWKANSFSGEKALKAPDLIQLETEINPLEMDNEQLAFFYVSCVFRRHNYHTWGTPLKDRKKVIWHLCNLLFQTYQRPFWRAAFILQYADSSLFQKVVSEFPKHMLENGRIRVAVDAIINKDVERYLSENTDRELYAKELAQEFFVYRNYFDED